MLHTTAFAGGSYLARSLSKVIYNDDVERIRHEEAIEEYQIDYETWRMKRQKYQDWLSERYQDKIQADQHDKEPNSAFILYAQTHPDFTLEAPLESEENLSCFPKAP